MYVATYGDGAVWEYTIGAGGQLTYVGKVTAGGAGLRIRRGHHQPGRHIRLRAELCCRNGVGISASARAGHSHPRQTHLRCRSIAIAFLSVIDPTGKFAYVAVFGIAYAAGTGNISQYSIGTNGALTALPTATVSTGGNPRWLTLNPAYDSIYVPNASSNSVQTFAIGSSGDLTLTATAALAAATDPDYLAIDPVGQFVYVANRGGGYTGLTAPFGDTLSQFVVGGGRRAIGPKHAHRDRRYRTRLHSP